MLMLSPFILLAQTPGEVLRLAQQPGATTATVALQHFSDHGCVEVSLDAAALQNFLRALPRVVLLTALDIHEHCQVCGLCQVCLGCDCPPLEAMPAPWGCPACAGCACHQGAAVPPRWPVLGMVCACEAQAGVHVADEACVTLGAAQRRFRRMMGHKEATHEAPRAEEEA